MFGRVLLPLLLLSAALAAASAGATSSASTLFGRTGPGFDITLRNAAGAKVTKLRAGDYRLRITDRSGDDRHNFHLVGPGVDMRTGLNFVGGRVWRVKLRRGTYRFVCDPHAFVMHGSFKVV